MRGGSTLRMLAKGAAFRALGSPRLGRDLAHAFLAGDESARTAAGILLVRAGNRSLPVLTDALADPKGAELVEVLASIDTPEAGEALRRIAGDGAHPAAALAREALGRRARP